MSEGQMTGDRYTEDLPMYVLGELDPARARDFHDHIASCAACRREVELLRNDTALLALAATGSAPPARARKRLLSAIANEPHRPHLIPARPRWWSFAPLVAMAVLALFCIMLWTENQEDRERLVTVEQELAARKSETAAREKDAARAREVVSALTAPDAAHFTLVAAQTGPQPTGRVIYVRAKGQVLFFAGNFAPAPAGKAYELWLIPTQGAPIASGTFKPDARGSGSIVLPALPVGVDAKAFAITVEPESGSAAPTTAPILVGTAAP
ncbi:MAG: anti-sigma factor [Acidobacteriales bacterium]|nr:anti-sigma factor [Terriglobales bacterium]